MHSLYMMLALLAFALTPSDARSAEHLDVLQVQVMLDRAGFSPGVIDGRMGANTEKALAIFQNQGNREYAVAPVTRYLISPGDAAGPFSQIPTDIMRKALLPVLDYTSLLESIAERFHSTPAFLRQVNPDAGFVEGEEINVPNVMAMVMPFVSFPSSMKDVPEQFAPEAAPVRPMPVKPDVFVAVTESMSALTVTDANGRIVFYAPVSIGGKHDPLPIGNWVVNGVRFNPTYLYSPDMFWNADSKDSKAMLPAGPNNPVGLVWIDISKAHYGLHGTPEPSTIGHTQSHGCVRLTNWDATRLAGLVKPGTPVVFDK